MDETSTSARIVRAADELFYRQGYEHTSFADIAGAVNLSRGNFYYHFKTKDEILEAVIALRMSDSRGMLEQWDIAGGTPADRIRHFIDILIDNKSEILRYGCPLGTLSAELAKLDHPSQDGASNLFELFRNWLRVQFEALGRSSDADALAMHLLARSQGVATLASAFHDEAFIQQEVEAMYAWLDMVTGADRSATG
ncbi:MAG: TetR/AcrR family transcriptional regulator [Pseudomonadota bacterium]